MVRKICILGCVGLFMFGGSTFALATGNSHHGGHHNGGSNANAGASASAGATAIADVDNTNVNLNINENSNTNTNTNSNTNTNDNKSSATIGDISMTVESSLPAANIPFVPSATPHLMGGTGGGHGATLPANALGVDMTLTYLKNCQPEFTGKDNTDDIVKKGGSGMTTVTFTPHSNFSKGSQDPIGKAIVAMPPNTTYADFYVCLGIIKTEAIFKKAGLAQFGTIINDTGAFTAKYMKGGYKEVYLVTVPKAIAINMGATSNGNGLGVAPGGTNVMGGNTLLSLGGLFSDSKGYTFPSTQLGTTFLVLAKKEQGTSADVVVHKVNVGSLIIP
ncbi:MAG: hypothetical protein NUV49_01205 [Patescibacteria group bacterium]|nr:hypothetical protein [Patescibacteria group bacterium]